MHYVVLTLGIALLGIVAIGDVRTRRIPNELVVGILVLAALRIALVANPSTTLYTFVGGTVIFVITFLFYWRGLLGGGDVKLMAVTALLVGHHYIFGFLFVMSLCGAVVAIAVLAVDRLGLHAARAGAQEPHQPPARPTVPYGVAIAAAGVFTLLAQTLALR